MDLSYLVIVIQLIFLEGILSIDNAAVLGAMVTILPDNIPVTWPEPLKKLGKVLHPLLGNQRTAALRVGLLGAYAAQATMLILASIIVRNPWLKMVGAAYLIRLAIDNLGMAEPGEGDAHVHPIDARSFWIVVLNIEMADIFFSLDNVVAAVTLSNQLWVVMLGVAIGILMMRFAAGWFSRIIEREPVLKTAAYILVLNIGVEMIYTEITKVEINDWLRFGISIATILLAVAYARIPLLQNLRPLLTWIAHGLANVNEMIDWALVPVLALVGLLWKGVQALLSTFSARGMSADRTGDRREVSSPHEPVEERELSETQSAALPVHEELRK